MAEDRTPEPPRSPDILPVSIEDEMRRSYLDYAMSVIVSRALPDLRDGLKPVHRRILHAMNEQGYDWNRPYRKSARVVGDVMGRYHPHGDSAIYDAMVRMAQDFSMRLPLLDGQGNFGSMDGDPPAAMRYTEVRLERAARELLDDIDEETVDFAPNYDETAREPAVLPAKFPNLLVNGADGIAVGMATRIPPHNLGEIVDACCAMIDNPGITVSELVRIVPGPDFPTGGIIMGRAAVAAAYETGRGSVRMRGRTVIEKRAGDREAIVVTEIPFQENKAKLIEGIADLVREKKVENVSDLRDESDRDGVRVVIEIRRGASAEVVRNQLHKHSRLQTSFPMNMLAIDGGKPLQLGLRRILEAFLEFRREVVRRRTAHRLGKARDRAHVLVGLAIAVANIDEIIAIIRAAGDPAEARARLTAETWPAAGVEPLVLLIDDPAHRVINGRYRLSEAQARAILELRLQRLTGLEQDKIAGELGELAERIGEFLEILASPERILGVVREELLAVRERFATPRRTTIEDGYAETEDEDLIPRENMVVTVSHTGYIKRVPLSTYRAQRRGGKGRAGMSTRDEDFVTQVSVCDTHTTVLFFSTRGIVYQLKVHRLPAGSPQARGKALVNLLPLRKGETVAAVMPKPADADDDRLFMMFATESGQVRRNRVSDFASIMSKGKIAMKLEEGDSLIGVRICRENQDIMLAASNGRCIRFPVADIRVFRSRDSTGVRGMRLAGNDRLVSMTVLDHVELDTGTRDGYLRASRAERRAEGGNGEDGGGNGTAVDGKTHARLAGSEQFILTATENGFGKRTSAYEYRVTRRGGRGIVNIVTEGRNGAVVASFPVAGGDQIMLVTDGGQIIRSPVRDIRIAGRNTSGVTLFDTSEGEKVVSVAHLAENGAGEIPDGGLPGAEAPDDGKTADATVPA